MSPPKQQQQQRKQRQKTQELIFNVNNNSNNNYKHTTPNNVIYKPYLGQILTTNKLNDAVTFARLASGIESIRCLVVFGVANRFPTFNFIRIPLWPGLIFMFLFFLDQNKKQNFKQQKRKKNAKKQSLQNQQHHHQSKTESQPRTPHIKHSLT